MIANLVIELDNLDDEIMATLNKQRRGIDWMLAGVIDDISARKVMDDTIKIINERLRIITQDYGKLLSRNDMEYIKERIEHNKKKLSTELGYKNIKPIGEQEYIDELGQKHILTEKDFQNSYEKEVSTFIKHVDLQKMRLENYYKRVSFERWQRKVEVWVPIIISTLSLTMSILALIC